MRNSTARVCSVCEKTNHEHGSGDFPAQANGSVDLAALLLQRERQPSKGAVRHTRVETRLACFKLHAAFVDAE